MQNIPPAIERTWYSDTTSLTKLLSTLTATSLDEPMVINQFLNHLVPTMTQGFTNNETKSGFMPVRAKSMEARLQQPLDGMAKRQCLSIGINYLVTCMAYKLNQVNQILLCYGDLLMKITLLFPT